MFWMWDGNVLCVCTKSWERLLVGVDQQVVLQAEAAHSTGSVEADGPVASCT